MTADACPSCQRAELVPNCDSATCRNALEPKTETKEEADGTHAANR